MFRKFFFLLITIFLLTSFAQLIFTPTEAATDLNFRKITYYNPVRGGDSMQGGANDRFGNPIKTLEDVANGKSSYITIARDTKYSGAVYKIPSITFKDSKGETRTLTNVEARVSDTGSAFRTDLARPLSVKNGRLSYQDKNGNWKPAPEAAGLQKQFPNGMTLEENRALRATKVDIAAYTVNSTNEIKTQPSSFMNTELVPENEKAKEVDKITGDLIGKSGAKTSEPSTKTTPTETTAKEPTKPVQQPPKIEIPKTTTGSTAVSSSGGFLWDARDRYCHKHTGAASASELKTAMTCNAGFKCVQTACGDDPCYYSVFVKDCGPRNANCDSAAYISGGGWCPPKESNPQDGPMAGCLNYKCKQKPNAIWDMGSKKCGCG